MSNKIVALKQWNQPTSSSGMQSINFSVDFCLYCFIRERFIHFAFIEHLIQPDMFLGTDIALNKVGGALALMKLIKVVGRSSGNSHKYVLSKCYMYIGYIFVLMCSWINPCVDGRKCNGKNEAKKNRVRIKEGPTLFRMISNRKTERVMVISVILRHIIPASSLSAIYRNI